MLKPTIKLGIDGDKIRKYVHQKARHLVRESQFDGKKVDLVSFPHESSKIVTSAAIEKVINKLIPSENIIVVVGWDFTIEARNILDSSEVILLCDRYFGWTDDRWHIIKQS